MMTGEKPAEAATFSYVDLQGAMTLLHDTGVPLLQTLTVADVMEPEREMSTVASNTPLADVVRLMTMSHDDYYPVLDGNGRFVGIFSARDVREFAFDHAVHHVAIAEDLMTSDPIHLTLEMDLHDALTRPLHGRAKPERHRLW